MPLDLMSADIVRPLNETECWDLLDATSTGRLVVVVGGMRILPSSISGRAFRRSPGPERS